MLISDKDHLLTSAGYGSVEVLLVEHERMTASDAVHNYIELRALRLMCSYCVSEFDLFPRIVTNQPTGVLIIHPTNRRDTPLRHIGRRYNQGTILGIDVFD